MGCATSGRAYSEEKKMKRREFIRSAMIGGVALAGGTAFAATVKKPLPGADLGFIGKDIKFEPRSQWTDIPVKAWRLREAGKFDRITIHHQGGEVTTSTDRDRVIRNISGVLTGHAGRGYGDIGYHFVVDYAGTAWEGRSLVYEGAHVAEQNEKNIGIMLLGNFELQSPSEAQMGCLKKMIATLRDHYQVKKHRIYGHRDLGASACPGKSLYSEVVKIKA
jgi:N-acetylmuramoyl-L-alanine amidase